MKLLNEAGDVLYCDNLVDDRPVYVQILEHVRKWCRGYKPPNSIVLLHSEMALLEEQSGKLSYLAGIPVMCEGKMRGDSKNTISMQKAKEIAHWIQKMDEASKHLHEAKEKLIELGVEV